MPVLVRSRQFGLGFLAGALRWWSRDPAAEPGQGQMGNLRVSYHAASEDMHKLVITLPDSKPRTLADAFQGTPNALMLKSHAGIQSWLGSQLDAPFPAE